MSYEAVQKLHKHIKTLPGVHGEHKLTCLPSPHDPGYYKYHHIVPITAAANPATIDYRPNMPPVNNQLNRGCCTSEAWAGGVAEFLELTAADEPAAGLSVAFHYVQEKQIDGMPGQEGSTPVAGAQVLQKIGVCPETVMPTSLLLNLPEPQLPAIPAGSAEAAAQRKITTYAQLFGTGDTDRSNVINIMRQALQEGPFMVALLVCTNFAPDENGIVPVPNGAMEGGHAVCICGDRPDIGCVVMRNSWGSDWGVDGYCYLPYEWFTSKFDLGWYVFEGWCATKIVVPKAANKIVLVVDSKTANVDGTDIALDEPAGIDAATGRTLVPERFLATNLGLLVQYNAGQIILKRADGSLTVEMALGQNVAIVNGSQVTLTEAPRLDTNTNRTLLPARDLAQICGYSVNYDSDTQTITITKGE